MINYIIQLEANIQPKDICRQTHLHVVSQNNTANFAKCVAFKRANKIPMSKMKKTTCFSLNEETLFS